MIEKSDDKPLRNTVPHCQDLASPEPEPPPNFMFLFVFAFVFLITAAPPLLTRAALQ